MNQQNTLQSFLAAVRDNESLLKGYASKKCKECLGRGYKEMAIPRESSSLYMCNCVVKNVKKEFSS